MPLLKRKSSIKPSVSNAASKVESTMRWRPGTIREAAGKRVYSERAARSQIKEIDRMTGDIRFVRAQVNAKKSEFPVELAPLKRFLENSDTVLNRLAGKRTRLERAAEEIKRTKKQSGLRV